MSVGINAVHILKHYFMNQKALSCFFVFWSHHLNARKWPQLFVDIKKPKIHDKIHGVFADADLYGPSILLSKLHNSDKALQKPLKTIESSENSPNLKKWLRIRKEQIFWELVKTIVEIEKRNETKMQINNLCFCVVILGKQKN